MNQLATTVYVKTKNRYHELVEPGNERGLTTTEVAILTFILVGIATAVGWILFDRANGAAEAIPTESDLPDFAP